MRGKVLAFLLCAALIAQPIPSVKAADAFQENITKPEVIPNEYSVCIDQKIECSFGSAQNQTYTAVDENGIQVSMQLTDEQSSIVNGEEQYSKTYSMSFSEVGNKNVYVYGEKDRQETSIKISVLAHEFSEEWTIDKEPTCMEEGMKSHHCIRCGEEKDITSVPIGEHAWDEGKITQEPNCLEAGSREYTCKVCGQVRQEKIEAVGHVFAEDWTVDKEATCIEEGRKSIHCKVCGAIKENSEEVIPVTGEHTYGEWYTIKEPTWEAAGVRQHECEVCGVIEKEEVPKLTGSWKRNNVGWWYALSDGTYLKDCKVDIAGRIYAFNRAGYMITGWNLESGIWYYYDISGAMVTGWQHIGIRQYFMDTDGKMLTGKQTIGNATYYFASSGNMITGWNLESGIWHYYDVEGVMVTGWQYIGVRWYFMDNDGKVLTGRQKIGNATYYFASGGNMVTGWNRESGKWYYYDATGAMMTGWQHIGSNWYFLNNLGEMLTGWQYISEAWYYLGQGGAMMTGWQRISGEWYYLNIFGRMETGWLQIGSNWYYLQDSGVMVTGWQFIGKYWYYLENSGVMARGWRLLDGRWYLLGPAGNMLTGWQYVSGYKYYLFSNGVLCEDLRSMVSGPYYIKVNRKQNCVTIYARDGEYGYIIPVKAFLCSTGGTQTPLGTFTMSTQYRWHQLYGAYGQYCSRIVGHILFHSVPYYRNGDNYSLMPGQFNRLGSNASAGCVRLCTGDAKWIYDNCYTGGTQITIYDSDSPGPFSKPVLYKIPYYQNWDPTDPNI